MNLHAATAYAMHLLTARSTAGHGVHSPFMFHFITEVIGGRSDRAIVAEVESLRREMLSDNRVVMVTDLGAGSSVIRDSDRSVRQNDIKRGGKQNISQDASHCAGSWMIQQIDSVHDRHTRISQDASILAGGRTIQQIDSGHDRERSISHDASMRRVKRSVRQIASAAAVPKREAAMLARIAASLDMTSTEKPENGHQPVGKTGAGEGSVRETRIRSLQRESGSGSHNKAVILELGSSLGISTLALALGAPQRRVISVEGCPELAAIARENLFRHGALNAEVICMEFGEALIELKNKNTKVALAFIDGNHRGAMLTDYVHKIRQMGEEMIIVADDIHMNRDMIKSWRSISYETFTRAVQAPALSQAPAGQAPASLETLRTGILFCLPTITPGHYRVRY